VTQPRTRREPSRGRGRPTVFDEPVRTAYLDLIRHGMRLGDAAAHLNIARTVPARHTKTDREFAAALQDARTVGAKVRVEDLPHDEYRYNILKCRCPTCRAAATTGRAARRHTEAPPGEDDGAQVHPIRVPVGESLPSFLLARAS